MSKAIQWYTLILLLLAFFCLLILDTVCGPWDHDSGYYLLRSRYIYESLLPFRDFSTVYLPFYIYLNSVWFFLKIEPSYISIGVPLLWSIMNGILTFMLVKEIAKNTKVATAITSLYFLFAIENGNNHVTLEHGVVFFSFLILIFKDRVNPFVSSIIFLSAFFSKQIGVLLIGLSLYFTFVSTSANRNRSAIAQYLMGFIIVFCLFLLSAGFDLNAIYQNLVSDFSINASMTNDFSLNFLRNEIKRSPFSFLMHLFGVVSLGYLILRCSGSRRILSALVLFTFISFLAPRGVRDYPHYSMNCWPFIAWGIAVFYKEFRESSRIIFTPVVVSLFAVTIGLFIVMEIRLVNANASRWQYGSAIFDYFNPIADLVKTSAMKSDTIQVFGSEDIFAVLSGLRVRDPKRKWYQPEGSVVIDSRFVFLFNDQGAEQVMLRKKLSEKGYKLIERSPFLFDKTIFGALYVREGHVK